jgi:hypothetical protein
MTEERNNVRQNRFVVWWLGLLETYEEAFWRFGGEFFRDASVLVAVFGLLERNRVGVGSADHYVRNILVIAGVCFVVGLYCWRQEALAKAITEVDSERI